VQRAIERQTVIRRVRSYVDALGSVAGVVARSRPLRRVELAFAFFKTTETATWIAMLVYAYERGGVTESGLLAAAVLAPAAVIAPLAAAVADRYRPGVALLFGYVTLALCCLAVAAAMAGGVSRFAIYALLGTVAVATTLIRPSQVVFAPAFARTPDELTATNVVSNWIESLSALVAPLIAGVLLALYASP
jgi:MFS family permease